MNRVIARLLNCWLVITLCLLLFSLPATQSFAAPSDIPFYVSPVDGTPQVLKKFDKPPKKWMAGHRGIDIATIASAEIHSPADGEVTFSGKVVDRTVITIKHSDGRISSFEPVIEPLPQGSIVKAGDVIAKVDPEIRHCDPSYCLHWGVRTGKDDYINPLLLLGIEKPSVLLPLGDDFSA